MVRGSWAGRVSLDTLADGVVHYTDREYRFKGVPKGLVGAHLFRCPCHAVEGGAELCLKVTASDTTLCVLVAHGNRGEYGGNVAEAYLDLPALGFELLATFDGMSTGSFSQPGYDVWTLAITGKKTVELSTERDLEFNIAASSALCVRTTTMGARAVAADDPDLDAQAPMPARDEPLVDERLAFIRRLNTLVDAVLAYVPLGDVAESPRSLAALIARHRALILMQNKKALMDEVPARAHSTPILRLICSFLPRTVPSKLGHERKPVRPHAQPHEGGRASRSGPLRHARSLVRLWAGIPRNEPDAGEPLPQARQALHGNIRRRALAGRGRAVPADLFHHGARARNAEPSAAPANAKRNRQDRAESRAMAPAPARGRRVRDAA